MAPRHRATAPPPAPRLRAGGAENGTRSEEETSQRRSQLRLQLMTDDVAHERVEGASVDLELRPSETASAYGGHTYGPRGPHETDSARRKLTDDEVTARIGTK